VRVGMGEWVVRDEVVRRGAGVTEVRGRLWGKFWLNLDDFGRHEHRGLWRYDEPRLRANDASRSLE